MNDVSAKITVKGLVQGVGFRYFTYNYAIKFGLKGYVENMYAGDVETFVEGDKSIIEEFISVLRIGPRSSRVTKVIVEWKPFSDKYKSFNITF
ncbi:acylphosphatase [candidate division KSB1 bacterium]